MDLVSKGKSLRERVEELSLGKPPSMPCPLSEFSACCKGKGYAIYPVGPYAQAELCSCVQECKSCMGKAKRFTDCGVLPCKTPDPRKIVNLLNHARIPSRYAEAHMSRFGNLTKNEAAYDEIRKWLQEFPTMKVKRGLLLSGPVGVGKTYLLTAIARALIEKNICVRFVDFLQLISQIKAAFTENKSEHAVLAPIMDVDVLIIDELGKGRNTDFEAMVLDQLVVNRYNENKVMVASTNLSLEPKLLVEEGEESSFHYMGPIEKRVGHRIYSRLRESTSFITLMGEDVRKRPHST